MLTCHLLKEAKNGQDDNAILICFFQERTMVKPVEFDPPQRVPDWPWQMHGQVSTTLMPLFSHAASSGFSFSATSPPIATAILPSKPQNTTAVHSLCFAASTTNTINTPQHRRS